MVVLALLSAASRANGRPRRWEIWVGQYAGFALLAGLSVAAGRGLSLVPGHWLWLLALVPLGMGVVTLIAAIRSLRHGERLRPPSAGGLFGVAALTIVNGADNLAAYTPFFAAARTAQVTVTLVVFAAGVALWCLAGGLLVRHERLTSAIGRYGHWILPAAFMLIGTYLLYKTNAPFF